MPVNQYPENSRKILQFIVAYKQENDGLSPTLDEIRKATGIPSKSTVFYTLEKMEQAGKIHRIGSRRNIALPGGHYVYEGAA